MARFVDRGTLEIRSRAGGSVSLRASEAGEAGLGLVLRENRGILLSMHQPRGFRRRGWADLVIGGGETVAELVDRHGSELLELPK